MEPPELLSHASLKVSMMLPEELVIRRWKLLLLAVGTANIRMPATPIFLLRSPFRLPGVSSVHFAIVGLRAMAFHSCWGFASARFRNPTECNICGRLRGTRCSLGRCWSRPPCWGGGHMHRSSSSRTDAAQIMMLTTPDLLAWRPGMLPVVATIQALHIWASYALLSAAPLPFLERPVVYGLLIAVVDFLGCCRCDRSDFLGTMISIMCRDWWRLCWRDPGRSLFRSKYQGRDERQGASSKKKKLRCTCKPFFAS